MLWYSSTGGHSDIIYLFDASIANMKVDYDVMLAC